MNTSISVLEFPYGTKVLENLPETSTLNETKPVWLGVIQTMTAKSTRRYIWSVMFSCLYYFSVVA